MAVTIHEVAVEAGVSTATVSRYFSGTSVVLDVTARKIDAAAARLGYVPGDRRKRKRSPSVVAVLFSGIKLQYYSDALKILIEESRRYDYRFLLIPVTDGDEQWKKIFTDLQITGVIYLEEDLNPDIRNYIKAKNIKTVMFGDSSQDRRSKMIHVNDLAAARAGCQYLLSLRHRRILILSDAPQKISTGFQRIVGCRRAFEEMGAEFSEDLLKYGELTWEEGRFLVRQALKQNLKFTAVFAFSDEMAMGAISALKEAGLSVPGDVSVMGFDGLGLSKKIVPRLTTVEQPMKKMAEIALDSFLSAESEDNLESIVPYKIEEGETCREVE
ncbi:MAG: LacI family transcriptional regulator [Eubacterium sp.]|jgi:DNA-binding LacI/PurR family transcriptional regulator|nr:LacI family transcriptional regulator [Eubacterium sp.]